MQTNEAVDRFAADRAAEASACRTGLAAGIELVGLTFPAVFPVPRRCAGKADSAINYSRATRYSVFRTFKGWP